ncbi:uncharacterized protein FIBRA_05447 [Fibroporia radiculosa]|uniref:BSD domain-containing protein n=1 Tax=Fibroporia radiculosa TaxID=599839 RepID=J4H3I2_9APHY|nr:uncharacterized protein FIBRA_05447 [Fibroporia radiculosa]CCM03319.1 predicted protein [Fibroporia radiculosa]
MNFLDAYDIAGTPTPPPGQQSETSLNDEVTQVVGQLSRFWGGFRKQSQSVIEAARKDLGEVVSQAQKELSKYTADSSSVPPAAGSTNDAPSETDRDNDTTPSVSVSASASSISPADTEDISTTPNPDSGSQALPQSQTLLGRLQASLPPQLVSSVQEKLPDSIKHARGISLSAPDFATLRSTLTTELQRVQGTSEDFLHRMQGSGEELFQRMQGSSEELFREAGEFLKDAVRVVPPEEGGFGGSNAGVMWDGTDVWMIPTFGVESTAGPPSAKGKERETEGRRSQSSGPDSRRPSMDGIRAATTRAEALLTQLRYDPQVLRADPAAEGEAFDKWAATEVDGEGVGGIEGDVWKKRVDWEMNERPEMRVLYETLVPTELDAIAFWTRYFFRVNQVEREEERRRALLRGAVENEEDFSWEDDDDEATSPTALTKSAAPAATTLPSTRPSTETSVASLVIPASVSANPAVPSRVSTPGFISSRESEDSYDVVSAQASSISGADVRESEVAKEKDESEDESEGESEEEENEDDEAEDDNEEEEEDGDGDDDDEEEEEEDGQQEEAAVRDLKRTSEQDEEESDWE